MLNRFEDSHFFLIMIPFSIESQREISMGKPYSEDLRQRIVSAVEAGSSRRQAAQTFSVSASSAVRVLQRWNDEGVVAARAMGAPRRSKLDDHEAWLLELIRVTPDMTLEEIQASLHAERSMMTSIPTIWRFYDRHDISFKKNRARR
jgi:transposase